MTTHKMARIPPPESTSLFFQGIRFSTGGREGTVSPAGRAGKAWSVLVSNNGDFFFGSRPT